MDPTQILKISGKYREILQSKGARPQPCDTSLNVNPGDPCIFDHCLWMCSMIDEFVGGNPEKALRWVCFIQGVLWNSGLMSIDSMREDNRLALAKST
jgi:hypothetical protein